MHQALNGSRTELTQESRDDAHRDAALAAAADGLHADIVRMLTTLTEYRAKSDALVEACVACLEAALCIAGLVADGSPVADTTTDRRGQEAVYAMRAAMLAVRLALVEEEDGRRRRQAD